MEIVLGLIILLWVLPWILKKITPWLLQWFIRRQAKKFMGDAFPGSDSRRQRRHGQRQYDTPRKQKKIDPSVGEYIEFTEISGTVTNTDTGARGEVKTESQITDIEWEDLP